ncbi:MAG: menaquinol oxidoreductase [Clostridiales bacterium]|nr:MAG: menaquinol oxidoreductase [Clostridiales bacterium]
MSILLGLGLVLAIIAITYVGVEVLGLTTLFGIVLPYVAVACFIVGFVWRIVKWAKSPVPFRIPTTCGQQQSLDFIKQNKIENPSKKGWVVVRMILEVLTFRSLFRNTKAELTEEGNLAYQWEKWLWLFALMFHWGFFFVLIRHLRFFTDPVPGFVTLWEKIDGVFWVDLQALYLTGFIMVGGLCLLLCRRLFLNKVRYISLLNDYFPLFLLISIGCSGMMMRYLTHTDITRVKELAMSWVSFHPAMPGEISVMFYIHLALVCVLLIYFPLSKLMHAGGIFFSPTRNMANNNRMVRHINPWNPTVKVHTYEEYEDEFRDKMRAVGLPLDKDE